MNYKINSEEIVHDDYFQIKKAEVTYDTFKNNETSATRFAFERGDSVAVLLFEKDTDSFLLTRQFRYPITKHNQGWIIEIPAGSLEENEKPEDCVIREVEEELGYGIHKVTHIHTFYTSPGGSTERMFLFYAETETSEKITEGGGNIEEQEDIQLIKIPETEIKKRLPEFQDAKTIIAFQWYLLNEIV